MSTITQNTHTIAEQATVPGTTIPAPKPPAAPPSKRCIELDGLRGLAALCAVLYHYTDRASRINAAVRLFRHAVSISPAGMDMFFVLSGFLIGGILLKSVKSPNYYKTFYVRRFFRIIPIYYLWVIVFGIAVFLSPSIRSVLPHGYTLPMVIGVYFLFIQNFATPVLRVIWLEAAWSLAVEEHFYLFMPALVRRFSVKQLVQGLVAVILLSPPLRIAVSLLFKRNGGEWGWWTVYAWTFCRIDALALGVLLAIAWANPKAKAWLQDRINWVYASMAALLALSAMFEYLTANQVRYTQALTDGFGRSTLEWFSLSLMIIALVNQGKSNMAFLRWSWLRQLGKLSYCVYLTHWGIFWAVMSFGFHRKAGVDVRIDLIGGIVAFLITLGVAQLSWHFIEEPLMKRSHRYSY